MLWRDDGSPTFHLASVVDDIDFGITHVIRGSDHRAERGAARGAAPCARHRAAGRDPPRARRRRRREEAVEARRRRDGRVAARRRLSRRGGARVPRGARPAASTTCTSISTASARCRSTCSAALDDEELAARAGVPVEAAPLAARGARPRRGAGARRGRARRHQVTSPVHQSGDAGAVRRAARRSCRSVLDKDEAKAIVRELKAVGGNLTALRVALTGAERGPELWAVAARAAARRGACAAHYPERVRLYDTYTRSLVELPPAPGPVRMYFCGPTVYARAHIGNARPFVVGMWFRSWLRATRLRRAARPQHHGHQRQDLRRGARCERRARRARDRVVPRGHGRPRARHARPAAEGDRVRAADRPLHRGARRRPGTRTRRAATSTSASRASPSTAGSPGQKPDQVEQGEEPSALKEDPRDFALWKANKPATEDTWWDSPWGRGRPGWHIECSAMAEEIYGPAFEIHGGGLDLVFPHHENEVAQSRALGHPFAQIWAHNGMLRFTGEKMSKSAGNVATIREALDEWGREAMLVFFLTASLAQADRLLGGDDGAGGGAARHAAERVHARARPTHDEAGWERVRRGARRRLRHAGGARGPARVGLGAAARAAAARARGLRARVARRARARRRRRSSSWPSGAPRRGPSATSRPSDRLRDELAALGWQMRDEPGGGYDLVRP